MVSHSQTKLMNPEKEEHIRREENIRQNLEAFLEFMRRPDVVEARSRFTRAQLDGLFSLQPEDILEEAERILEANKTDDK